MPAPCLDITASRDYAFPLKRSRGIAISRSGAGGTSSSDGTAGQAIGRRWVARALLLYSVLLFFGTLAPFKMSWRAVPGTAPHPGRIEIVPFTYACPKHGLFCPWDRGLNLVLLAPLGALLVLRSRPATGTARRVMNATVLSCAVSVIIETAQLFLPSRFPSTADVLLNTLGAFLAAWLTARLTRGKAQIAIGNGD